MRMNGKYFGWVLALAIVFSLPSFAQKNLKVAPQTTGTRLMGMGVELDPHFFSQNLTRQDGAVEAGWYRYVVPRVHSMRVQRFRMMLQPHWWEPYEGVYTFESPEMQSVCKVLDLAQECGADVVLVQWGCPVSAQCIDPAYGYIGAHWLYHPDGLAWVTRAVDEEAFARNFIDVVHYLVVEKGYDCIKEITPFNEPDGMVCDLEHYIPQAKILYKELCRRGLDDRIKLNLSDNTDCRTWFLKACSQQLSQEAGLFNSHTYIFGYETPNSKALAWEKENVRLSRNAGKKHFVGEFGSNQCVGAARQKDINWYKRGVLMVRNCLNFLNAGAAGASYWGLLDQYYGRDASYGEMQQLGLWRYKENAYQPEDLDPAIQGDYACRPQYYAYSLMTRFVRKGDWVYAIDTGEEFVAASAILGQGRRWTYIFANNSDQNYICTLTNSHLFGDRPCVCYRYQEGSLPSDGTQIAADGRIEAGDGKFSLEIPAQTVLLLTQE